MNLNNQTQSILKTYGIFPKKSLGQNFLVDKKILRRLVSHANLKKDETVLEIGAGLGFLTNYLAREAGHVIAVELDFQLVTILRDRLKNLNNVTIIDGDIMEVEIPFFDKCVSTPPYYISSSILFWLFKRDFTKAIMTFQDEFANRLGASVGSKEYGRLTVTTYYWAHVEILDHIPRSAFIPQPEVNSRIVYLKKRKLPFKVDNEKIFFRVTRDIFTQKNKLLRNAVIPLFRSIGMQKKVALKIADTLPFNKKRPRELTPEEIALAVNGITGVLDEKELAKLV